MHLYWPLTGRSGELRLIESALSEADSAGIVIRGAVGVGKSRLAHETLDLVARRGWQHRCVVGTCSARALPLGALSDWVGPAEIVSLDVIRTVIDDLTSAGSGTPVVICVDDVVFLDDLTTFVIQQIVRRGAAKLVITIRAGDVVPEATQELLKSVQFEQLMLEPLAREEAEDLVATALDGRLEPDSAERLWELTRGNALYLRNIVESEVADGRLVQHGGSWTWSGTPVMPPGLVELIETRMGALPAAVSEVVDMLAVAEPLDIDVLSTLASPAAVEDAETRGLITLQTRDGDGTAVRLAHPLYGEVRRERAAQTRLRRLRGLIAQSLVPSAGDEDVHGVVRRAALRLESDLPADPQLFTAAAQGAVSLADMTLAERLADAAIRAGAGTEAYFVRSWALAWINPLEAEAVLAGIPAGYLTEEEDVLRAGYRSACLLWGLADPEGAKHVLDEVSPTATGPTRGWVDALYIMYWAAMARPRAALRCSEGVDLADVPPLMGAASSWALGVAFGDSGCCGRAIATYESGYDIVTRSGQGAHLRYLIGDRHLGTLLQYGLVNDAQALARHLREQAADLPGGAQLLSAAIAGRAALGAGRPAEAHSLLEPAIEAFFAAGDVNGLGYRFQISDTIALAMVGDTDSAAAAFEHCEQHAYRSYGFVDYERELARAWVEASQGVVAAAIDICLSAAATTRRNGQIAAEVVCLQTATQFGDRSCGQRLQELVSVVEGPRCSLAARLATALHAGDAAELASLSEEFERIGDLGAAVDAAAHAALAYRHRERRGSALICSSRAEALAAAHHLTSPALRQAGDRLPLTDREREIAMLLARKMSTPAIADRLTLSRRTVENHIYRAMAKTGVASRDELASLMSGTLSARGRS